MSDKTKTLQDFSDEIAKELKYDDFDHLFQVKGPYTAIHCINEAAERYAAYARKQGFDQGVDVALQMAAENAVVHFPTLSYLHDTKNVNKQSILDVSQAAKEQFKS